MAAAPRLNVYLKTHCNGHHYLLLYPPEKSSQAMLAVLKWFTAGEFGLCRGHANGMQEAILAQAQLDKLRR